MVIEERSSKKKVAKSVGTVRKFFKNRESEITEAVWKNGSLEIIFHGGSYKVEKITPEEAALILNRLYLASGSLFYQALGQMIVQEKVIFRR